ncbi:hypothetical protein C8J56DRAFT_923529 [Mycena floridula]|nr:hypothetical protein C8J56DRAFT_923529 [Mycena floridula]
MFLLRRYATAAIPQDGARILRVVEKRVQERMKMRAMLSDNMASPENIARMKYLKDSEALQHAWDEWTESRQLLKETEALLEDPEMRSLASEEYNSLSARLKELLESTFPSLLKPASTTRTDHLSALLELKAGVGGGESSLFLTDMLRLYTRYAASVHWKTVTVSVSNTDAGGAKEAIVEFKGKGAYDALRWESGVHRVQRVPATEASGRIHTSTVAVIVLPLAEENATHDEELYSMSDVKIEFMRASGAGGQHVNKTESAVRLTHIPTGVTVAMQDERSQHQNRRRAFQVLHARLLDQKLTRDIAERRATRNALVHRVDRSEKIRTYNYAQERVTDHRIGLTVRNLSQVLDGPGLQVFIDALQKDHDETQMEDILREELDDS